VPAIDYAWHTVDGLRVGDIAKQRENLPAELYSMMEPLGAPGVCWVSKDCYEPKDLLNRSLNVDFA
jgi:hypothetical protein